MFKMDNKGNLLEVCFNGRVNEFDIRFDFQTNTNGEIIQTDEYNLESKTICKYNKEHFNQMQKKLKVAVDEYNKKYGENTAIF